MISAWEKQEEIKLRVFEEDFDLINVDESNPSLF